MYGGLFYLINIATPMRLVLKFYEMNIYRNKTNKMLYIIEHLILDVYHLNNNEFAGIYAIPYNWKGSIIEYQSKDHDKCEKYVNENFVMISHL